MMGEGEKKRHVDVSGGQSGVDASHEHLAADFEAHQVKRRRVDEKKHNSGVESEVDGSSEQLGGDLESHQDKEMPLSAFQSSLDDPFERCLERVKLAFRQKYGDVSDPEMDEFSDQLEKFHPNRWNPTIIPDCSSYAEIALESYKPGVKYKIVDELYAHCKSLKIPGHKEYADVRQWCHVCFTAKPQNPDGTPEHFFAEMVLDHDSRTHKVIKCCTVTPSDTDLSHGCGFCLKASHKLHPTDGYVAGLPSSVYLRILSDEYLYKIDSCSLGY